MPSRPMKPCSAPGGCPNLVPGGTRYCDQHQHLKRDQGKQYDRHQRNKRADKFYHSDTWKRLRQIKLRQNPLCEPCQQSGRLVAATMVHHGVEIREDMGQSLVMENLVSCCLSCHNKLHGNKQ